jgi:uroporphyrinogen-III synthase
VRVLIVRPAPGNKATAEAVAGIGLEPVVVPLFEVVPVAWAVPDPARFDAVVMTSANAARFGGTELARFTHLPLFAVGETTAEAARRVGFIDVRTGAGDAADLGPQLSGWVLHLTGSDHRPIPTGANVTVAPVYDSRPLAPSEPLAADIALIHSPRAGTRLAELLPDRAATKIVAISPAAARACGTGWAAVHIADTPREHAMLACLARLCEAPGNDLVGRR